MVHGSSETRCQKYCTRTLEVFESIKVFLDIKGFVYIIGLSLETISKLISVAYKESGIVGEQYIRKIIQIPIMIPEWNSSDVEKLVENLSNQVADKYLEIIQQNKKLITRGVELNPREVKRFINNFIISYEIYSANNKVRTIDSTSNKSKVEQFLQILKF